MNHKLWDNENGGFLTKLSDSMAMDSDGNLLMRMSDNMAIDLDSGDLRCTSSWKDDEDNE